MGWARPKRLHMGPGESARMRETYDHVYPPGEWDAAHIADALRTADGDSDLPTYVEADRWDRFRTDPMTADATADLLDRAADVQAEPSPPLTASRYLEYDRTGNRTGYQNPNRARRQRLGWFTLAECLERTGAYLDPILDYGWAICEQTSWIIPAHLRAPHGTDALPGVVAPEDRTVALRSAETAHLLAEVDHVLADQLHPALAERIRHEVDRRVFRPYEARDDHKWMQRPCNNWNAVCNGAIATAALHLLEDVDRLSALLEKAIHSLADYLGSFDPEGCTPEGMNYWNYGMSHYAFLAAELSARTDGQLSLLSPPVLERIAAFPVNVELSPGVPVPFSDAWLEERVIPHAAVWLGEHVDNAALSARGRESMLHGRSDRDLREPLRNWLRTVGMDPDGPVPAPPAKTYYPTSAWWIVRTAPADPDGLTVAAKGGHNAESHNHNDLGAFLVHVGGDTLLADLGGPTYDRDYFSSRRYEYLTARSLGHSVPYVNDTEQASGREHAAEVIDVSATDGDERFVLDLTAAYPEEAGLDTLTREITVHDGAPGHVTLTDEFAFPEPSNAFTEVLVSYRPLSATNGDLHVEGDHGAAEIAVDRDVDIEIERLEAAVRERDVWRARLRLPAVDTAGSLTLTTQPSLTPGE